MIKIGKTLQLKDLSYEDMAGTYKCTVTSIGGQSSGSGTLDVYCKYYNSYKQRLRKHKPSQPVVLKASKN